MESQKEPPFIKSFEDRFEPNTTKKLDSSHSTPIADIMEDMIVTKKSFWERIVK